MSLIEVIVAAVTDSTIFSGFNAIPVLTYSTVAVVVAVVSVPAFDNCSASIDAATSVYEFVDVADKSSVASPSSITSDTILYILCFILSLFTPFHLYWHVIG